MITFRVEDMTCGGCVRAIRAAVAAVAPGALVTADLASRRVEIEGVVDGAAIERAIAGAGFNAVRAPEAAVEARTHEKASGFERAEPSAKTATSPQPGTSATGARSRQPETSGQASAGCCCGTR